MFGIQTSIETASIVITMLSVALGVGIGIVQFRIVKMGEPFNNPCITPMAKCLYEQIKSVRAEVS